MHKQATGELRFAVEHGDARLKQGVSQEAAANNSSAAAAAIQVHWQSTACIYFPFAFLCCCCCVVAVGAFRRRYCCNFYWLLFHSLSYLLFVLPLFRSAFMPAFDLLHVRILTQVQSTVPANALVWKQLT